MYLAGLRNLTPTLGLIYGVQAACASFAVPAKTEKYYDLCGAVGFISAVGFSLYAPFLRARFVEGSKAAVPSLLSFHPRQLIMSGLTILWAARLGSFLFQRILRDGSDSRFDKIKQDPAKFFGAWMMQATWITVTALPVYLVNSIPRNAQPAMGPRDFIGLGIWLAGMGFEVVADRQKSAWRAAKGRGEHSEDFVSSGLWSISRHPNYFGECTLWTGQYILSTSALSRATPYFPNWVAGLAAISPLLEYGLIRYISGVPMLEASGNKKFKDNAAWKKYKEDVPVFFPFVGGK